MGPKGKPQPSGILDCGCIRLRLHPHDFYDPKPATGAWFAPKAMRKPSVLVIFLTVFIDLIGFGIVVPLISVYSRDFGAVGIMIGVIVAAFSAMQFVFAPIWGRLSDKHGRRPMLLISTAGAAASYVLFALASGLTNAKAALGLLIVSRLFAGMCGGNITVAHAYIADITPPDQRSKKWACWEWRSDSGSFSAQLLADSV